MGLEGRKRDSVSSDSILPVFCEACQVRDVSICGGMDDQDVASLRQKMSSRDVDKSAAIMQQDDQVTHLYVITHGSFRFLKILEDGRQQITGFGFPGDYVGVRGGSMSNYTVEALTPSRVCSFPHAALTKLNAANPTIQDRLISNADTELTKAYNHMVLLGQKTVHERVASFFCDLVERIGRPIDRDGSDGFEVTLSMSRRDIADYLALRSETLSRVLKDMKTNNVIQEVTRQKIVVSSLKQLQRSSLISD